MQLHISVTLLPAESYVRAHEVLIIIHDYKLLNNSLDETNHLVIGSDGLQGWVTILLEHGRHGFPTQISKLIQKLCIEKDSAGRMLTLTNSISDLN